MRLVQRKPVVLLMADLEERIVPSREKAVQGQKEAVVDSGSEYSLVYQLMDAGPQHPLNHPVQTQRRD